MNKLISNTVNLMAITLIGKILGFIRELVLAATYGTSYYSDAYLISINIPIVIFSLIGAALGTAYIPLYFNIEKEQGSQKLQKFNSNVTNIVILICIIFTVIGFIFVRPLINLFAIGFKGETLMISIRFTRILIFGIVCMGISNILTAYLQANNEFVVPGMISIPYNIIIIVFMLISISLGPDIMVYGTLFAMCSQFLFQLPFAYKKKFRYSIYINFRDEYIKKAIVLIAPVFIGIAVNQLNSMIDKSLASTLMEGSISALNYANKLNSFITALFISSIVAVIYPHLSKLHNQNNKIEFIETITKSINSIIILIIPISVGAIVLSKPIVEILFQRGEFDIIATNMTSSALSMYSIGMVAYGLRDVLGKIFYSLEDTKIPMINGSIAIIMNIILNILLIKRFNHAGLALATSISSIICIILLFRSLNKKIGYFGQDKIIKVLCKSFISALIMGSVSYVSFNTINRFLVIGFIGKLIALLGSVLIGVIIYVILLLCLNIEEVNMIKNIMISKIRKKSIFN